MTDSDGLLKKWLESPVDGFEMYAVTINDENPLGANKMTMRQLLNKLRPFKDQITPLFSIRDRETIVPDLQNLIFKLNKMCENPATNSTNSTNFKAKLELTIADCKVRHPRLKEVIDTMMNEMNITSCKSMSTKIITFKNLSALLSKIFEYQGDLGGIYEHPIMQEGGRKLTRRRKSNPKSKRYNKHGSKRRRSNHNKRR